MDKKQKLLTLKTLLLSQIVEEVQKFYSISIADLSSPNGTAIASLYHKTVSPTCPPPITINTTSVTSLIFF